MARFFPPPGPGARVTAKNGEFVKSIVTIGLVLLCPVAASAACPHDQAGERWQRTITVNNKAVPATDQLFWAGYSGSVLLPSTVGPAGLTSAGLPAGYQAIAASGRDKTAIAFSRLVEREIVGFVPPRGYE